MATARPGSEEAADQSARFPSGRGVLRRGGGCFKGGVRPEAAPGPAPLSRGGGSAPGAAKPAGRASPPTALARPCTLAARRRPHPALGGGCGAVALGL